MRQIIVNKSYLDDIKEAIMAINSFFSSGYQTKNFPLETIESNPLRPILHWLNEVDPLLIKEPERLDQLITQLMEYSEGKKCEQLREDETFNQMCYPIIAIQLLQKIADNFKEFNKIINGVYDLSLFIKPSGFKTELTLFEVPISMNKILDIRDEEADEDGESYLFDVIPFSIQMFTNHLFDDERIQLPTELQDKNVQLGRVHVFEDLTDVEIVIDTSVQESAEVTSNTKSVIESISKRMNHVRYEKKKFQISNELKRSIDFLINELRKCETSEDLLELFRIPTEDGFPKISPDDFVPFIPAILLRVFNNNRKYPFDVHDVDVCNDIMKIHISRAESNKGAKRFSRFDLFSCFKIDKEGTIKFLEDFLKLNFVNNSSKITISNNTLLTIFNIFDSNLYLSLVYEKIPNADRKDEWATVHSFIKSIRQQINKNSRTANVYKDKEPSLVQSKTDNTDITDTEDIIQMDGESFEEFSSKCLNCLGEMSSADMQLCDIYEFILEHEIENYDNAAYNVGWGDIKTEAYIAESFNVVDDVHSTFIMEQAMNQGALPDYMKKRMGLSDDAGGGGDPQMPPQNPIDDLADSVNTKLGAEGDLEDQLGKGFKDNPNKGDGKVVNNITNITIRDSHIGAKNTYDVSTKNDLSSRISNDLSTGKKTTTTTTNTNSNNSTTDNSRKENTDNSKHTSNDLSEKNTHSKNTNTENNDNNNNNSGKPGESKGFTEMDMSFLISRQKLTMEQVLMIVESDEPPSTGPSAGKPPKRDLLTTAMDVDKNTLPAQQAAKRTVQKGVNTVRAVTKPISRTKSWLTKIVNSLIKRDEDKVKAEIIENPSYRTALFKASRLALKFGMLGICYTITPYLGAAYLVTQGAKAADKQRMKNEIQEEMTAELKIIDDKIERASRDDTPKSRQAVWKMMRLKSKMERIVTSKGVHERSFKPGV